MAARCRQILGSNATVPIAVFASIVVAHLPSFAHKLLDGDEAIYGSTAVLMNMGGGLYDAGGVDNKPPGIFWVYALVYRAFGDYQMTAIHVAALLVVLATCAVILVMAQELTGSRRAGLLGALFYGLLTAAGNPRLLAANTEVFMMLPLCLSVLLMLRRRWFWSGVLLLAAGAFRQSAAVNLLLAAPAIFWLEDRPRRVEASARFAAGLAAGLLAGAAFLAATGSLSGFWRWTIVTLVGYASNTWAPAYAWSRARDSVVPFVVDAAVLWIAAVALASRWRSLDARFRLVVVWLALAMAGSVAPGHFSWHYFVQAMGPLAVLAALAFDRLHLRRAVGALAAVGVFLPAAAWWVFDLNADPLTYDFSPPIPQYATVAGYVDAHTSPGDRIFVWGDWPALYPESDRVMASRFPGFLRGFDRRSGAPPRSWDVAPDVWPLLQADFRAHPPRLIVDTSTADWSDFGAYPISDFPALAEIVATQYHQVATVAGVAVFARNGT